MDFWTILIIIAVAALGFIAWQVMHGKKLNEIDDVLRDLANKVTHHNEPIIGTTLAPPPVTAPAPAPPAPAPAVPAPVATPPAPVPAPATTELGNAYIDRDDLMKAIGTNYQGGVMLDGVLVHNGFGPFDYFETKPSGVVRGSKPAAAAPDAGTPVAIGAE